MKAVEEKSPVSFEANVRRLPAKGLVVRFEADAGQRAVLAEAHGLADVKRFDADLLVQNWKRDGVKVSGRVAADIVQACVVSLEPVPQSIDEEVAALFAPEGSKLALPRFDAGGEMLLSADGPDAPEVFAGETIDVGALAEEFFGLAIDPYPRSAGIADSAAVDVAAEAPEKTSPFEKLKRLIEKS